MDPLLRSAASSGDGYGSLEPNGQSTAQAKGTSTNGTPGDSTPVNGSKLDGYVPPYIRRTPLTLLRPKLPPPPHEQTWKQWFARFMKIVPYLWPRNSRKLQFLALACLVLLILGRGVNVLVPQLLGRVVRALGTYDGDGERVCKCPIWVIIRLSLNWCSAMGLPRCIYRSAAMSGWKWNVGCHAKYVGKRLEQFLLQRKSANFGAVGARHAILGQGNVQYVFQPSSGSVLVVPH